jgi:rare lipoprotein A
MEFDPDKRCGREKARARIFIRLRKLLSLVIGMMLTVPASISLAQPINAVRASYYADGFEGRPMSGGGKFHQDVPRAASLLFPLGTMVRVRSIKTGKEIVVKITDRGPWGKKFSLDLSKAAFQALGLDLRAGCGWVTVERVKDDVQ